MDGWIIFGYCLLGMVIFLIFSYILLVFLIYRNTFVHPIPTDINKPNGLLGPNFYPYVQKTLKEKERIEKQDHEVLNTKSIDGTSIQGYLYRAKENNDKVIICIHGYNSTPTGQFCLVVPFLLKAGYDVFLAGLHSDSKENRKNKKITFGVKEKEDTLAWIELLSKDYKNIALYGVSMGGATVLQTLGLNLPSKVKCVIDDCGFISYEKEARHLFKLYTHHEWRLVIKGVILFARIFGRFDLRKTDCFDALRQSDKPLLIIHGKEDSYVPSWMSEENFKNSNSKDKKLVIFPDTHHAQAYFENKDKYESLMLEFLKKWM